MSREKPAKPRHKARTPDLTTAQVVRGTSAKCPGSALYLVNGNAIMTHDLRAKLEIRLSRHNQYSVIQCAGRLVLEHGAGRLEALGSRELLSGRRLVVDLHEVEQMDARGVGAVATLYRNGLLADRQVVLVGVPARLRQLLKLTRLDSAPQRALCEVGSLSRSETTFDSPHT